MVMACEICIVYGADNCSDHHPTSVAKRSFSQEKRDKLSEKGHALPDGSFPIENEQDLKNAIQAIGRAKDPARARRHIIKRAKALGKTDLLPKDWEVKKAVGIVRVLSGGMRGSFLDPASQ